MSFSSYFFSLSCWGGELREWLDGTWWTAKVNPLQKDNTFLHWIISCCSKLYSSHHKWQRTSHASYNIPSLKEIWFPLQSPSETKNVWSVITTWREAKPIQVYEESQPRPSRWESLQRRSGSPGSQNWELWKAEKLRASSQEKWQHKDRTHLVALKARVTSNVLYRNFYYIENTLFIFPHFYPKWAWWQKVQVSSTCSLDKLRNCSITKSETSLKVSIVELLMQHCGMSGMPRPIAAWGT